MLRAFFSLAGAAWSLLGPASKLQQQLEQIGKLPAAKQRAIAQVLDAMLQQHGGA